MDQKPDKTIKKNKTIKPDSSEDPNSPMITNSGATKSKRDKTEEQNMSDSV